MTAPVDIIYVSSHRWRTFCVFNFNAFPAESRALVDACGSRLALVFFHDLLLAQAIDADIRDFRKVVQAHQQDLEAGLSQHPGCATRAFVDGLGHIAQLHSFLNALKSFLDVYAGLIGRLVNPSNNWTFNKAKIDNVELAGGRLVNALLNASKDGAFESLASLIRDHSTRWISQAVRYRDRLSHRSELDDMTRLHLPLNTAPPHIDFGRLVLPAMPNGVPLHEYSSRTATQLSGYIADSIPLLPRVDLSLLSPSRLDV